MLDVEGWMFREALHHFLARRFLYVFRARVQQMNSLLEQIPSFAQIGWRLRFQDELKFLGDVSNVCDLQRERHPLPGTHGVDCNWERGFPPVDNRLLEQQRFSTAARLHFT